MPANLPPPTHPLGDLENYIPEEDANILKNLWDQLGGDAKNHAKDLIEEMCHVPKKERPEWVEQAKELCKNSVVSEPEPTG